MKVLFLGTGTSTGVPVIGCTCDVCQSDNPRNKRLRSSILVKTEQTTILVDSCTDLRQQALRYKLTSIDAIIYTHSHLDHVSGFDELRAFCWERTDRLPLYAGTQCLEQLKRMYGWAFASSNTYQGYIRPDANDHAGKSFTVGDISITPVPVLHSSVECYGYIFRNGGSSFAYLPDVKTLPEASIAMLKGVDVIAMDGLGQQSHPTHLSQDENVAYMEQIRPKHGYITHSGHRLDYDAIEEQIPDWMSSAYDGLELNI